MAAAAAAAEAKVEYTAMLLGTTGNVGGRILHLLVQSPLCKKVVVVTRRNVAKLANPKVQQAVVNMDKLEEELAPHAKGVDIALAAFGVGKGSAKMADEEVRKIEIAYPTAFASAAKAGGARVLAMMTAVGADSQSSTKYLRNITGFCHAAVPLGDAVSLPRDSQERPGARHGRAVGAGVPRARAGQRTRGSGGEVSRVQGDGAVLRGG
jgi:hypothetical protein